MRAAACIGWVLLNEMGVGSRRWGMDYRRVTTFVRCALFAFSGCGYSASAHWSLGDGSDTLGAVTRTRAVTAPERSASKATPPRALAKQGSAEEACYETLDRAGVQYTRVAGDKATGVDWPILLTGPLDGVRIQGAQANAPSNYLDCRLARALLSWTPQLRAAGVTGLQHYSMYRKGAVVAGSGSVSGHAHGYAIDVAAFELQDGRRVRVLQDWAPRARGADPCDTHSGTSDAALMRELVCDAAAQSLFQLVLTPHYNDAHADHLHLEVADHGKSPFVG